jgi:hypothetical protein
MTFENFPQPPRSTHAAILHLALPGDPSLTAGSILPMHMGLVVAPKIPQLDGARLRRLLLDLGDEESDEYNTEKDAPDVAGDGDQGQDEGRAGDIHGVDFPGAPLPFSAHVAAPLDATVIAAVIFVACL